MRSALAFRLIAAAAAVAAATAGVVRGTSVAGGSDSYCYLSQAELFASGHVMNVEPIATRAPWDRASDAFIPVGHVRAHSVPGATVPMCPPGYPLIMAIARTIAGRPGMFAVVPILGGLGVWWTFLLGRRVGGPPAGAVAAVLFAASPPFLYQIVQPMTDVPAAALWAAALLAVTSDRFVASFAGALTGGLVTGTALIVRPNLLPVAAVTALAVFNAARHEHAHRLQNMDWVRRRHRAICDCHRRAAEHDVWRSARIRPRRSRLPVQARSRLAEPAAVSRLAAADRDADRAAGACRAVSRTGQQFSNQNGTLRH
jgi:hypothetical protein